MRRERTRRGKEETREERERRKLLCSSSIHWTSPFVVDIRIKSQSTTRRS
jgi:hypothetical protein